MDIATKTKALRAVLTTAKERLIQIVLYLDFIPVSLDMNAIIINARRDARLILWGARLRVLKAVKPRIIAETEYAAVLNLLNYVLWIAQKTNLAANGAETARAAPEKQIFLALKIVMSL